MVSGMFFLNPQKEITLSKLYRKNIFRIVLAIIFWGILYRSLYVLKVAFVDKADVNTILMTMLKEYSHLLFGPAWYHLWFLYMIIGLYMLVPLLRIFTQSAKEEHYRYLFIIFILFGSILPLLNETLSLIDSRLNINFGIKELLGFSVYFILGYYLSKYELSRKTKLWIYILAIISILFQIIGTSVVSWKLNVAHQLLYKNYTPNVAIQATAVFLIIKDMTPKIHFSERTKSIIFTLSRYSFGIYLVHDLFNQIFSKIGFTPTYFNPILTIPLRAIITFLLSFLIIWVLDKIPFIRKYCM
jgi:surface polysaccharide O-acyltransferase-like enzyme